MSDWKTGLLVNEKDLLDAINETVEQSHLGEGTAGTKGLEAPIEPFQRKALIHDLVEGIEKRTQRFENGAANGRAHDGKERVRERGGILANRFAKSRFDGGC